MQANVKLYTLASENSWGHKENVPHLLYGATNTQLTPPTQRDVTRQNSFVASGRVGQCQWNCQRKTPSTLVRAQRLTWNPQRVTSSVHKRKTAAIQHHRLTQYWQKLKSVRINKREKDQSEHNFDKWNSKRPLVAVFFVAICKSTDSSNHLKWTKTSKPVMQCSLPMLTQISSPSPAEINVHNV